MTTATLGRESEVGNPAAFEHGLEYPAATWEPPWGFLCEICSGLSPVRVMAPSARMLRATKLEGDPHRCLATAAAHQRGRCCKRLWGGTELQDEFLV